MLRSLLLAGCAAAPPTPASPARQTPNVGEAVHDRETLQRAVDDAVREAAPGAGIRVQPWRVGWGTNPGDPWAEAVQLTLASEAAPGDFEGIFVELRAAGCDWPFPAENGDGLFTISIEAGPHLVKLSSVERMLVARGELRSEQRVLEPLPIDALARTLARRFSALPPGEQTPKFPLASGG